MTALTLTMVACKACSDGSGLRPAGDPVLPEGDETWELFPAGATAMHLQAAVDRGIASRGTAADPGGSVSAAHGAAGIDSVRFVVIRSGDRYGADYRPEAFHVVVGAGLDLPVGSLKIRRDWNTNGMVDGNNEYPQVQGVAIVVEPQAPRPYAPAVTAAVTSVAAAVAQRAAVHPDCVLAMGEIPYTRLHEADVDERALAAAARATVPPPPVDGHLTIHAAGGPIDVVYERRDTSRGIAVGMMLRRRFDGEDRGMLFVYPHASYRYFWMFNCRIPIDVAYIREGRIEQICSMVPEPDTENRPSSWRRYDSSAAVRHALEMPGGWFDRRGVKAGDRVELE